MTRYNVEKMAKELADSRYELWRKCGNHNWSTLPTTHDTGDHYCVTCLTLFSPTGEPLNKPESTKHR